MSRDFAADGYVLLDGFLDAALLADLRPAVQDALATPTMPGCERPHNRLVALRWNDKIVQVVLARSDRMQALAAHIGARDLTWISGYISVKEAHTRPLWWHQDWWCWRHPVSLRPAAAQVALLCYLSDTSPHNGALRVVPGSHHRSIPLHAMLPAAHDQDACPPHDHAVFSDYPDQVTLGVRAGDAVVIDYRLLHGTHANESIERRDSVLLSFTPSWRELPEDVRAHLIRHPAQPTAQERGAAETSQLGEMLPGFTGMPADLELSRHAPACFAVGEETPPPPD
jgi:ectoine hydroxylase-related dioxygenase (phytanoyl-CoA dioxygenase family)